MGDLLFQACPDSRRFNTHTDLERNDAVQFLKTGFGAHEIFASVIHNGVGLSRGEKLHEHIAIILTLF